jgi:hypothetical protein
MEGDATVNVTLTLSNGDLMTNGYVLYMGMGATSDGTADVVGTVSRTDLGITPRAFGNPFNTITIDSGTPPTQMDVTLDKFAPASFTNAVTRMYMLTPTGGSGFSATVRLHYLDSELNGNTEAALELFRYDTSLSQWVQEGPKSGSSTTDDWVEKSGVMDFSDWTLSDVSPTAVEVAAFTAKVDDEGVVLDWGMASETHIAGFNVLRSADEGRTYEVVNGEFIPAQSSGRASGALYRFRDQTASGIRRYWYRLEIVGLDGARRRSEPVSVVVKRLSVSVER